MSCRLARRPCEQRYGVAAGEVRFWLPIDHRLFDVPPRLAPGIAVRFRLRGWGVIEEPI